MARSRKRASNVGHLSRMAKLPNVVYDQIPEGYKLSEVLLRFMAPYLIDDMSMDDLRRHYTFGVLVWNLSFFPPHERIRQIMPLVQRLPVEEQFGMKQLLGDMIARKENEFAEYDRMITDFELLEEGESYTLFVLSTPIEVKHKTEAAPDGTDEG